MSSSISASSRTSSLYAAYLLTTLIASTAAAVGAVQWVWTKHDLFARISPMRYQLHLAERTERPVEVLAVGDSHTALGLYPDRRGVMNVGYAGESVRETRLKMRYLLPRLPELKTVLLQSQPQMLFPHRDKPASAPYRELAGSRDFHPFERWLSQFYPCCRARTLREALSAIRGRAEKGPGPDVLDNGYLDYTRYVSYDRARFSEIAVAEIASYRGLSPVPALASEFDALIDDILAAGVRVVLVKYPLSQSYWHAIGQEKMREVDEIFRRAAESHGLTRCGSWNPQPEESHLNPDHLTPAGARQYWPVVASCALGSS